MRNTSSYPRLVKPFGNAVLIVKPMKGYCAETATGTATGSMVVDIGVRRTRDDAPTFKQVSGPRRPLPAQQLRALLSAADRCCEEFKGAPHAWRWLKRRLPS